MSFAPLFQRAARAARNPVHQRNAPSLVAHQKQICRSQIAWRVGRSTYSTSTNDSVEAPDYLSEGELKVFKKIKETLQPTKLEVQDISGGCGSMYALDIVSDQFKGLTVIKQHRLVNKVLGDDMKAWHGVQMKTMAPS
ncbi:hypothetical protein LTR37_005240 [Vermiconidia calcicola]|uniref:Uncharacterized protein n=1 Tax=Vermiconidia calcicola TaxID=1690605 RepID=A0ACC3NJU4_9PEZI|nr:hypothetical protein LTR37_005240 [Vermiconidia calcicola]